MTDFLYSSRTCSPGELSDRLKELSHITELKSTEIHGSWGSLCLLAPRYSGFQYIETPEMLFVVIGGPLFQGRSPAPDLGLRSDKVTREIFELYRKGDIDWALDLSGPFSILIIDKYESSVRCITDHMLYVPVYTGKSPNATILGTHVDAVATQAGRRTSYDAAGVADFVLHGIVTHPYTIYDGVTQLEPGAIHTFSGSNGRLMQNRPTDTYWLPHEHTNFPTIRHAAEELRLAVRTYINRVTDNMETAGVFLSGGEDSRAIAAALPPHVEKLGYLFVDRHNREAKVAKAVAAVLGVDLEIVHRHPEHYIHILGAATALVGGGHQFGHAHSLGFSSMLNMSALPAVFGGYISDSLLKGASARYSRAAKRLPFAPRMPLRGEDVTNPIKCSHFSDDILEELNTRRSSHFLRILRFRNPDFAQEWFTLWPMTMRIGIPNVHVNRRLFASYEPFLSLDVLRIATTVPIHWKTNRRLFWLAMRQHLSRTASVPHADGGWPALPWWANVLPKAATWLNDGTMRRLRLRPHQGPWADWTSIMNNETWARTQRVAFNHLPALDSNLGGTALNSLFRGATTLEVKLNALQMAHVVAAAP